MNPRILSTHHGRAFFDRRSLEGKLVAGNPAETVFCAGGLPSREEMAEIARQSPGGIVTFLTQHAGSEFGVRFYFPDGGDTFLCGHGSVAAAYFIHLEFGYERMTLRHETNFEIPCKVEEGKLAKAYLPAYGLEPMTDRNVAAYQELLGLTARDVVDRFYCPALNDNLLVLKDCATLRRILPDYAALSARIKGDGDRALMVTAASDNPEIDYEIRVFCPYVEHQEDISCGSANCYLLPYWKKMMPHKTVHDKLAILCPFKPTSAFFGGIEFGNYDPAENRISISGRIDEPQVAAV